MEEIEGVTSKELRQIAKKLQATHTPLVSKGHMLWVPGYGFIDKGMDLEAEAAKSPMLKAFLDDIEKG